MKNKEFLILIMIFISGALFAQAETEVIVQTESSLTPAMEIEALLNLPAVSYAQAARIVLDASESLITQDADEAFRYAQQNGWLPKNAQPQDTARMDGVSLLLMKSFGTKGGIFYSIAPNAHYAYRELSYKNVIIGRSDPAMNVSGERLLFMIGKMLE